MPIFRVACFYLSTHFIVFICNYLTSHINTEVVAFLHQELLTFDFLLQPFFPLSFKKFLLPLALFQVLLVVSLYLLALLL